jgi:hypothetical protein
MQPYIINLARLMARTLTLSSLTLSKINQGLAFFLGVLATLMSFTAVANAAPTHQVEAIIFERTVGTYNADEAWRKNPSLSYPLNYRMLKNPNDINPNNNIDSFVLERPDTTYALKAEAYALRKKPGYRVLFHKAWQQTLTSPSKSPVIVITGGDKYDDYFELSGSLRISLSKYLHVSTDLWLTQFTPNLGNTMDIPYLPLTPDLVFTNHPSTFSDNNYNSKNNDISFTLNNYSTNNDSQNSYSNNTNYLAQGTVLNTTKTTEQRSFLPQRITTTTQSARMRSMELHYIDHPRIGVLIKIIPMRDEDVLSKTRVLENSNNLDGSDNTTAPAN